MATLSVEPFPTSLLTDALPPWASAMAATIDRPSLRRPSPGSWPCQRG